MIPYYDKDAGIKTYPEEDGGQPYVLLDKDKVDAMGPNIMNTFETVRAECEKELVQSLSIIESSLCISPDGDGTYLLNFEVIPSNGGLLL